MINLEVPAKFTALVRQTHQVAVEFLRPNSRKYDQAEHSYPRELDTLAALVDGMDAGGAGGHGAARASRATESADRSVRNGGNMGTVLSIAELCWGDAGLVLSLPRQGLGNSAIAAVATKEQLARFQGRWAAMAITEPGCGSDSANIQTTARLDGDHYVLNGEKIFVTAGARAEMVVVWATLDKSRGRAAIRSFVVEKGTPGFTMTRVEHKLGIKASDTANFILDNCRVPRENLLGSPDIAEDTGFSGVMQTFDNTRPLVAAMAVGLARAALDRTREILTEAGVELDYDRPARNQSAAAAELLRMEADIESAYLLVMQAAWMADNGRPNSTQASMAKAKAGRMCVDVTSRCVELCGSVGFNEHELLEKWARDSKIFDIFEGTQQIQQLIIARRLLGKTSAELK